MTTTCPTTTTPSLRSGWTLLAGLLLIVLCEVMLLVDVQGRGGVIIGEGVVATALPRPTDWLGWVARRFAVNMTPLCWVGYLLVADGALVLASRWRSDGSIASIRRRPNRFMVAWLTSIPVWCAFDWFNFYHMEAWHYRGLPPMFLQRLLGYFIAFAAISPGMFLAAQLYLKAFSRPSREPVDQKCEPERSPADPSRLAWILILGPWLIVSLVVLALLPLHGGELSEPRMIAGSWLLLLGPPSAALLRRQSALTVSFAVGLSFVAWTLLARDPLSNFTLWTGLIYLLDPVNAKLGAPSVIRDWQHGRWGRTVALAAAGLTCGLLWEFWNYWAIAKWTYDLPFLGPMESVRYFEMPLPGLLGFIPFAGECWVMLNTIIAVLDRLGLRMAERLPDVRSVL